MTAAFISLFPLLNYVYVIPEVKRNTSVFQNSTFFYGKYTNIFHLETCSVTTLTIYSDDTLKGNLQHFPHQMMVSKQKNSLGTFL